MEKLQTVKRRINPINLVEANHRMMESFEFRQCKYRFKQSSHVYRYRTQLESRARFTDIQIDA